MLNELGIRHRLTPLYMPQANPVERANKTMKTMIAQYCYTNRKKWDERLPEFMFAVNTARRDSTGYTPAFLNFSREPEMSSVLNRIRSEPTPDHEPEEQTPEQEGETPTKNYATRLDRLKEIFENVRINLSRAFTAQCHYHNLRRREWRCHPGDLEHHGTGTPFIIHCQKFCQQTRPQIFRPLHRDQADFPSSL